MDKPNLQVTAQVCPVPSAYGSTHHLVPRWAGRTSRGEARYVPQCRYCGVTEESLSLAIAIEHGFRTYVDAVAVHNG